MVFPRTSRGAVRLRSGTVRHLGDELENTLTEPPQEDGREARLSDEDLDRLLERHEASGENLGRCLLAMGWPTEEEGLKALARALNIRFVDPSQAGVDPEAARLIPGEVLHRSRMVPVTSEDGVLLLAMENPLDFEAVDYIRILTGRQIERAVCTESDLEAAMQSLHGLTVQSMIEHFTGVGQEEVASAEIGHLHEMAGEPTVVNLVNLIILRAVRDRASDIHIEPFEREMKVKYRIDGVLHEMPAPPKHLHPAIVSRVKIMADMNIAERYLPQDGHIELKVEGHEVDVRVATIPTMHGECMALRLLDKSSFLLSLEDLGFEDQTLTRYRELLKHPHGIVLVCGPTGSGKTTTLYASLSAIYTPERKFVTIEDPVEYELPGVNQIPVRPKRGLTFANGLRAMVRQDPDIIMVGEVRDKETADIAVRAALTGHLVFSTLHTNDACEAIPRLLDMGVEPYLAASAMRGIVAQRLVRNICPFCKERDPRGAQQLRRLGLQESAPDDAELYRGAGCRECHSTGYSGRTAIGELLVTDERVQDLILNRSSAAAVRREAGEEMLSMREAGCRKVLRGITTAEEVLRVTQLDETS